mmetsp:Transcript_21749/g.34884  ORF Transcript_21749/g.34884 Transcript_21749/m.34884 type:complete len:641 (+) Transcript_21749:199-2121(+)
MKKVPQPFNVSSAIISFPLAFAGWGAKEGGKAARPAAAAGVSSSSINNYYHYIPSRPQLLHQAPLPLQALQVVGGLGLAPLPAAPHHVLQRLVHVVAHLRPAAHVQVGAPPVHQAPHLLSILTQQVLHVDLLLGVPAERQPQLRNDPRGHPGLQLVPVDVVVVLVLAAKVEQVGADGPALGGLVLPLLQQGPHGGDASAGPNEHNGCGRILGQRERGRADESPHVRTRRGLLPPAKPAAEAKGESPAVRRRSGLFALLPGPEAPQVVRAHALEGAAVAPVVVLVRDHGHGQVDPGRVRAAGGGDGVVPGLQVRGQGEELVEGQAHGGEQLGQRLKEGVPLTLEDPLVLLGALLPRQPHEPLHLPAVAGVRGQVQQVGLARGRVEVRVRQERPACGAGRGEGGLVPPVHLQLQVPVEVPPLRAPQRLHLGGVVLRQHGQVVGRAVAQLGPRQAQLQVQRAPPAARPQLPVDEHGQRARGEVVPRGRGRLRVHQPAGRGRLPRGQQPQLERRLHRRGPGRRGRGQRGVAHVLGLQHGPQPLAPRLPVLLQGAVVVPEAQLKDPRGAPLLQHLVHRFARLVELLVLAVAQAEDGIGVGWGEGGVLLQEVDELRCIVRGLALPVCSHDEDGELGFSDLVSFKVF